MNAQDGAPVDYRELIRLGSLAASSHNTQPWTFSHDNGLIRIEPDFSRRCPVVDPDDAHLFKSLGCAAENIVHAAAAVGLRAAVESGAADAEPAVTVRVVPDPRCREADLARAITSRATGHPRPTTTATSLTTSSEERTHVSSQARRM